MRCLNDSNNTLTFLIYKVREPGPSVSTSTIEITVYPPGAGKVSESEKEEEKVKGRREGKGTEGRKEEGRVLLMVHCASKDHDIIRRPLNFTLVVSEPRSRPLRT